MEDPLTLAGASARTFERRVMDCGSGRAAVRPCGRAGHQYAMTSNTGFFIWNRAACFTRVSGGILRDTRSAMADCRRMAPSSSSRKKKERRLARMSEPAGEVLYLHPPEHVCTVLTCPVPLDDDGLVQQYWVQWLYKGKVVRFSIELQVREHSLADWVQIYRIDTCHGVVHEHVFQDGDDKGERRRIVPIPLVDSWDFVTEWFDKAMERSADEWPDRLKEWFK